MLAPNGTRAQDVLVWAVGNEQGNTQGVADYLMESGFFGSVSASDDPSLGLGDLLDYQAVLFFTSAGAGDMNAIGDILADYADTGRRLVLAVFCWANQGSNTLGGRIITDGLSPFVFETSTLYSFVTMVDNDGHPIFADVYTLEGYHHDDVTLVAGAVQHGTWSDGEPLAATKNNVYALNLFPDDMFYVGGDYRRFFANSLVGSVVVGEQSSWTAVRAGFR